MKRENRLARLLRALTDKTQQELADKLDIPKGMLTMIEVGKLNPSPGLLDRMREAERWVGLARARVFHSQSTFSLKSRQFMKPFQ